MNKFFYPKLLIKVVLLCLCAQSIVAQKFVNPLPIPPLMKGANDVYNITISKSFHNFNPNSIGDSTNAPVGTNCYNEKDSSQMSYLGPTMYWKKNHEVTINFHNKLQQGTTVHWHGVNLPAKWDGGPHNAFGPDSIWSPKFRVIEPTQTVWYHSHLMDSTTLQVIKGLGGMIIIEDENDMIKDSLPHEYGKNDFPLVIQEKGFKFKNHKAIAIDTASGKTPSIRTPGNGPYTVINGSMYTILAVPQQVVRFRMLNASPRKSFHLGISSTLEKPKSFMEMNLIATDGGYTSKPYVMDSALISPGERMEFIVDFSKSKHGDTLYLSNLIRSMSSNIIGSGSETQDNALMAFVVDKNLHPKDSIMVKPANLVPYSVDISDVDNFRRTHYLYGGSGSGTPWTIDHDTMNMMVINDTVEVNTKEMWTIKNTTNISHPFHIHKVQFQVYQILDSAGNVAAQYPNLPDYLMGYKDDVLIRAYTTLKFVARFDSFPSMIDPMESYMYHCHILTHEDNSMMHQFVVASHHDIMSSVQTAQVPSAELSIYPNPANNLIYIKGANYDGGTLRIVDVMGRTLKEENITSSVDQTSIDVQDLPRGFVNVIWKTEKYSFHQKVLLK